MALDLTDLPSEYLALWRERHLCTLATHRPDGTIHAVPVGATLEVPDDGGAPIARVIASDGSKKVRNVDAYGADGGPAVVSFVDGARWATVEGTATVTRDPERIAEAVQRYAERYREPRLNPQRVAIEIRVTRAMGRG